MFVGGCRISVIRTCSSMEIGEDQSGYHIVRVQWCQAACRVVTCRSRVRQPCSQWPECSGQQPASTACDQLPSLTHWHADPPWLRFLAMIATGENIRDSALDPASEIFPRLRNHQYSRGSGFLFCIPHERLDILYASITCIVQHFWFLNLMKGSHFTFLNPIKGSTILISQFHDRFNNFHSSTITQIPIISYSYSS